jgi:hypothetical protein
MEHLHVSSGHFTTTERLVGGASVVDDMGPIYEVAITTLSYHFTESVGTVLPLIRWISCTPLLPSCERLRLAATPFFLLANVGRLSHHCFFSLMSIYLCALYSTINAGPDVYRHGNTNMKRTIGGSTIREARSEPIRAIRQIVVFRLLTFDRDNPVT